jgi:hypothetical protein
MIKFHAIRVSGGTLEALKWLGLITMTLDHFNRILLAMHYEALYCIGRLALPLFAFVFAYNLAQNEGSPALYFKSFKRLIFFGLLATPAFIAMRQLDSIFPLNIMFTLLAAALTIYFYDEDKNIPLAVFSCLIGGMLVEYSWAGIILCAGFWLYCIKPTLAAVIALVTGYTLLYYSNGNNWGLAALPIISLLIPFDLKIPRLRYLFWIFYPLHLSVFVLIKWL